MLVDMRFLGLVLILAGAYLAVQSQAWLPTIAKLASHVALPALPLTAIGVTALVVGLALLAIPRRSGAELSDREVREELARRGFTFSEDVGGWRASGEWAGQPLQVRKISGYEASRFGRPWVIEVSLRGKPSEPWPLSPERGKVVDVRDHGFSVTIPELSHHGRHRGTAEAIDAVVAARA